MKITINATALEYAKLIDTMSRIEAQLHGSAEGDKCTNELMDAFTNDAADAGPGWKGTYDSSTGTFNLDVEDALFIQTMEFINAAAPVCLPLIGGLKKLIAPIANQVKELFFKTFARFIPNKKYVVISVDSEEHTALAVIEDDGWGHIYPVHIFHMAGYHKGDDPMVIHNLCRDTYKMIMADEFMNADKILGKFDDMDEAVDIAHKRFESTMFVGTPS